MMMMMLMMMMTMIDVWSKRTGSNIIYDASAATMNVPIVAGDVVDDGGFDRPRFVRVSWYHYRRIPIEFHDPATSN